MIKSILAASILALGVSAGAASAQERTISVWGHTFTTGEAAPQASLQALAPRSAMQTRSVSVDHQAPHRDNFYQ